MGDADIVAGRAAAVLSGLIAEPLPPGLYLVATPIGNLADITLRALSVLHRADVLYCEDTRHSRTLLAHYGLSRPLRAYHEHNAARERQRILAQLQEGKSVAVISDAGTPLISDPGYKLVREANAGGHAAVGIPGPSAILAAIVPAGVPTDTFLFAGFLPAKRGARRARISELKAIPATLVLFEAPQRLQETLVDLVEGLGNRDAVVARELTKLHEEVRRGSLAELAEWAAAPVPRGEITILVGPPKQEEASDAVIAARLEPLLGELSLRDAAKAVAAELGVPKARVYALGLALQRCGDRS